MLLAVLGMALSSIEILLKGKYFKLVLFLKVV